MKSALSLAAIIGMLAGCHRSPSIEKKLIGPWAMIAAVEHFRDGSEKRTDMEPTYVTFTPDHRELWLGPGGTPDAVARWHLEGNYLVFAIVSTREGIDLPRTEQRERIARVTETELVFTDGEIDGVHKRVR